MQISDLQCATCEQIKYSSNFNTNSNNNRKKEYDNFLIKYKKIFNHSDNQVNLNKIKIKSSTLLSTLAQLVPCVGCRTGVERFYKQLTNNNTTEDLLQMLENQSGDSEILSLALEPLVISGNGYLTINENAFNARALFDIFYMHGWVLFLLSNIKDIKISMLSILPLDAPWLVRATSEAYEWNQVFPVLRSP
jgi:hypothetical protein